MRGTTFERCRALSTSRIRTAVFVILVTPLGSSGAWGLTPPADNPPVARLSPPGESYIDPEVLQIGAGLVFQTGGGEIWFAEIDPATGLFTSNDGRDELVDTGAYPVAVTWSGPELGVDASGWSVLYAKATAPGGPPQIWRAERSGTGWSTEPLTGGDPHQTQLATTSLTRTGTRILNIRGTWSEGTISWFSENDPAGEHAVIVIDEDTFGRTPARWSRDGRFVLHRDERARVRMVDADLGTERLIVDDGSVHDDPNAWPAPELGGELLVATVADDTRIAIFRDLGGPTWTRIATLEVPAGAGHDYYGSPEPLVVDGRSYLSLVVKNRPNHSDVTPTDSEVWVVGIEPGPDGAPRDAWRSDDGAPGVFRSDPETFVGSDEVFVYYSVIDPDAAAFYELWRARTGIPATGTSRPEVEIEHGWVRGVAYGGADAFRGLPYAAPPVGENRWRPPQPVAPWNGVRDAAFFGSPAPQTLETRVGGDSRAIGDEDCLFLNVWTPSDRLPGERLPVMVFIHGGGNLSGAGSEPVDSILELTDGPSLYDGALLAAQGRVVVVTLNYRLGPLGYLTLPALDAEGAADGGPGTSGNYGILDQVAALEWVERNIAAFGGDRRRVLLFGQSGGARNTSVHLTSPLSRGLFQAAAMHSGVPSVRTRGEIDGFTAELLDELGFTGSEPDLLERLRAVPSETFATAQAARFTGLGAMRFGPHVDHFVLDDQPYNVINRGGHAGVPFVIGSNSAEYAHRFADIPDSAYQDTILATFGPAIGAQVLAEYPVSDFASAGAALDAVNTDKNLTCSVRRTAGWVASNQSAPVFRYWFDHTLASSLRLGDGAYHTSELLLLFQHVSAGHLDGDQDDLAVESFMLDAWTGLAATGSPDVGWRPSWPAYDPASDPTLHVTAVPAVADGVRSARCDFWDGLARSASRPPELGLPAPPMTVAAGRTLHFVVQAEDPDGDDVDFTATGLPAEAHLDGETGALRWRTGPGDIGTHRLVLTATDVWGASSSGELVIEVTDGVPPPRWTVGRVP